MPCVSLRTRLHGRLQQLRCCASSNNELSCNSEILSILNSRNLKCLLALYGLTVNTPPWDFGKLLGLYVVLFFLVAQVLAKVRFDQSPTAPILLGGSLIVAGGAVITFWKQ